MPPGQNLNTNRSTMQSTPPASNHVPLSEPVLLCRNRQPFSVSEGDVTVTKKVKLQVEFPTQPKASKPNNISMYLKQLMTVLFAVDKSMKLHK